MRKDLSARTKMFALRAIRLYTALPRRREAQVIGDQLLRSGTSIGANYREADHARSRAEFASKIGCCLQEADETAYWIELLIEAEIVKASRLEPLLQECRELVAIFTASLKTAKRQLKEKRSREKGKRPAV